MPSLVFVHDHRFSVIDGIAVSSGGLSAATFNVFLKHYDAVDVCCRAKIPKDERRSVFEINDAGRAVRLFANSGSVFGYVNFIRRIIFSKRAGYTLCVRLPSEMGLIAAAIYKLTGGVYAAEVVGCGYFSMRYRGKLLASLYAPFRYWAMRAVVKYASSVSYVDFRSLVCKYPSNALNVAYGCSNITATGDFNPRGAPTEFESKLKNGPLNLFMAGSVDTQIKGFPVYLKALRLLRDSGIQVQAHFAGKGSRESLKSLVRQLKIDDVVFDHGFISNREKYNSLLYATDIYVQASYYEGMPRALLEALSQGVMCVGSNIDAMRELLPRELCFDRGNEVKLAKLIMSILDEPASYNSFYVQSVNCARKYSVASVRNRKEKFWRDLISESIF